MMVGPLDSAVGAAKISTRKLLLRTERTVRCIYHEGIWEPIEGHSEIGPNTIFPNVFDIDALSILQAHL